MNSPAFAPNTKGRATRRCVNDEDFGSGGIMLLPDVALPYVPYLLITADKESTFYVVDRTNLTGYNSGGDKIVQELTTPTPVQFEQGYWGSPAYWEWTSGGETNRAIYYSVDATSDRAASGNTPYSMNMYLLTTGTPGPVPTSPTNATDTRFCGHGGAHSVSSNGTTANTGIVWAIEDSNSANSPPTSLLCNGSDEAAVLHAYDASNLNDLYTSSGVGSDNYPTHFTTPMVFNGRVYMATKDAKPPNINGPYGAGQLDVFGLCQQTGYPSCMN